MQTLEVRSSEKLQMINITRQVEQVMLELSIESGVCVLYVPHTTAGITINECADPSVEKDILKDLRRMVPISQQYYEHFEGNSAAHALSSLVGSSVTILVEGGRLALGRWQGIFFCEFDGPRARQLYITSYHSSI
jgi:secondary thiamine-phosphate synthase enzyme